MRILAVVFILTALASATASAVTLDLWYAWPNSDATVQLLAARYTHQTGITVRTRAIRPTPRITWGSYSTPDIICLYQTNRRDVEYMAARGLAYDLRAEIAKGWYALFWPSYLDTFSVRGSGGTGIYGIPLTGQVNVFIYNKLLFHKAGIGVPGSWGELMAASRRLRKIGVTPYAGGFGSDAPPLAAAYEYDYLGYRALMDTYLGHYPYTASQWVGVLKLYSEMKSYQFTTAASATASQADAAKALLDGRVAMIFADTGFEVIRRSYKPSFTAWGAFAVPDDPRGRFSAKMPGRISACLVINSRSPRKESAIAFARWMTEYNQQITLAEGTTAMPAMTVAANSGRLSESLQPFASAGMRDMAMDLRIYESPRVLSTFYSGVRAILSGKSTPTLTARRTQKVKSGR